MKARLYIPRPSPLLVVCVPLAPTLALASACGGDGSPAQTPTENGATPEPTEAPAPQVHTVTVNETVWRRRL